MNKKPPISIKNAFIDCLRLIIASKDMEEVRTQLEKQFGGCEKENAVCIVDVSSILDQRGIELGVLIDAAAVHGLNIVGISGADNELLAQALEIGLSDESSAGQVLKPKDTQAEQEQEAPVGTLIIDKPLRSGQRIYAKDGDVIILSAVNNGAEVIADGSIHVYAPLRGRAIAGANGDTSARIFAQRMEPELISIAGIYLTSDSPELSNVIGTATQIKLNGETLVTQPLSA